ncbi:ABC transporter permease [Thermoanaerobacter sp. YS13]|uniref:branched-chain amino acid ABC transporter permease n=1 Tax=Thermoanaerobacter sp. YS13 TaxID=1511746 RepID=UPI000573AEF8|nr:branched-chain amino acid ABC transporter permease [Thermoanaerobacter sp. YS13]KHO61070.1 ABC transporter permease [Thermoanaerobacter sp. YS13]
MNAKKYILWIVLILIATLIPPILNLPGSLQYLLDLSLIYAIVAIGLNLLMGYAGQISLGHGAFLAVGAYTSAYLTLTLHVPFFIALILSGLITGIVGILLGLPALKLEGNYLAIATLGFGVAVTQIFAIWTSFTGGFSGIKPLKPELFGFKFNSYLSYYYIILILTIVLVILTWNIIRTKVGRSLMAMRDSEIAAKAMGINVSYYKTLAFGLSAFYTGIAGSLYAHLLGFMTPYDYAFSIGMSLNFLAMIVIGGIGTISGSIIGTIIMTWLPQITSNLPIKSLSQIITGAIIIAVVIFYPNGIAYAGARLKDKFEKLFAKHQEKIVVKIEK